MVVSSISRSPYMDTIPPAYAVSRRLSGALDELPVIGNNILHHRSEGVLLRVANVRQELQVLDLSRSSVCLPHTHFVKGWCLNYPHRAVVGGSHQRKDFPRQSTEKQSSWNNWRL